MLKFIVNFEQDELLESVLYALLHAVDRFTINDNSEPTMLDSIDPNGPAWILVDEGMRDRHELIRDIFSVRRRRRGNTSLSNSIRLAIGGDLFSLRERSGENSRPTRNDTSRVRTSFLDEGEQRTSVDLDSTICWLKNRTKWKRWSHALQHWKRFYIAGSVRRRKDLLIEIARSPLGFTAFCQTSNSSVRLLVNCLIVQSEPMKVSHVDVGENWSTVRA